MADIRPVAFPRCIAILSIESLILDPYISWRLTYISECKSLILWIRCLLVLFSPDFMINFLPMAYKSTFGLLHTVLLMFPQLQRPYPCLLTSYLNILYAFWIWLGRLQLQFVPSFYWYSWLRKFLLTMWLLVSWTIATLA